MVHGEGVCAREACGRRKQQGKVGDIDERVAGSGAVLVSVFWHDLSVVQEVHVYSCVENWREI